MIIALHVLHQAFFGAVAAGGFGMLFNFGGHNLLWAIAVGALALAAKTVLQTYGWSLEASTFVATLAAAGATYVFLARLGAATSAIALAGCIPMIPGAFFNDALLGFLAVTSPAAHNVDVTLSNSIAAFLRVVFTLGAIGAGLTIPAQIFGHKGFAAGRLSEEALGD